MLGLDDAIAQRLPNLPAEWGPVTLRQLLACRGPVLLVIGSLVPVLQD